MTSRTRRRRRPSATPWLHSARPPQTSSAGAGWGRRAWRRCGACRTGSGSSSACSSRPWEWRSAPERYQTHFIIDLLLPTYEVSYAVRARALLCPAVLPAALRLIAHTSPTPHTPITRAPSAGQPAQVEAVANHIARSSHASKNGGLKCGDTTDVSSRGRINSSDFLAFFFKLGVPVATEATAAASGQGDPRSGASLNQGSLVSFGSLAGESSAHASHVPKERGGAAGWPTPVRTPNRRQPNTGGHDGGASSSPQAAAATRVLERPASVWSKKAALFGHGAAGGGATTATARKGHGSLLGRERARPESQGARG